MESYPELYHTLIKRARQWAETKSTLAPQSKRSAHEKIAYKAAEKAMKEAVCVATLLEPFLPAPWKNATWSIDLLRGTTLVIKQQGKDRPIVLSAPFQPEPVAIMLGALLGWSKTLRDTPNSPKQDWLYLNSYQNLQIRNGHTPLEALAFDSLMKMDFKMLGSRDNIVRPEALFDRFYTQNRGLDESTLTSGFVATYNAILEHPTFKAARVNDPSVRYTPINTHTLQSHDTLHGLRGKQKVFRRMNASYQEFHDIEQAAEQLLQVLNATTPRTGTAESWMVHNTSTNIAYARDGREAIILDTFDRISTGVAACPYEAMAFPTAKAYHGSNLDIAD